jgi:hypothetical protein
MEPLNPKTAPAARFLAACETDEHLTGSAIDYYTWCFKTRYDVFITTLGLLEEVNWCRQHRQTAIPGGALLLTEI